MSRTSAAEPERASEPLQSTATSDDIRACFRLLLGRDPSAEEWVGHSSHIDSPLEPVVRNYLSSLEFRSRGLLEVAEQLTEISIEDRTVFVYADDLGPSAMMLAGAYEPDVTQVLRRLLNKSSYFVDIGANVGYYSLIAAGIASDGLVVAVEPSVRNVRAIRRGVDANGFENVLVRNVAATADWELLAFGSTGTNGIIGQIAAHSDLVDIVQGVPLDSALSGLERLDLIKIDIEGAEMIALQGANDLLERFHPTIVSEFAPPALSAVSRTSGEAYLELLLHHGYSLSVILPDGTTTSESSSVELVMQYFQASQSDHIDIVAR